jgi:hypothetical protein
VRLHLGTSSYNTRGALVELHVAATVHSRELKRWRAQQSAPVRRDDVAAAGQIGNLAKSPSWLEWNLIGNDAAVAEVIATIERLALVAIEVLVWLGRRDAAEDHARVWLNDPDLLAPHESKVAEAVAAYELHARR